MQSISFLFPNHICWCSLEIFDFLPLSSLTQVSLWLKQTREEDKRAICRLKRKKEKKISWQNNTVASIYKATHITLSNPPLQTVCSWHQQRDDSNPEGEPRSSLHDTLGQDGTLPNGGGVSGGCGEGLPRHPGEHSLRNTYDWTRPKGKEEMAFWVPSFLSLNGIVLQRFE